MSITAQSAYKYQETVADTTTLRPLKGYYVKPYVQNTLIAATNWTDETATVVNSVSVTTDTNGRFYMYLAPEHYDIRIFSKSTDYTNNANEVLLLTDILIDGFFAFDAANIAFTPESTIAASTVQAAVVEAKADATTYTDLVAVALTEQINSVNSIVEQISVLRNLGESSITATTGQTVFDTGLDYFVGGNSLNVYVNGVRQERVVDYVETGNQVITFNTPIAVGAIVSFTADVGVYLNTEIIDKVFFGTAVPTVGTYSLGDIVLNKDTTPTGKQLGWYCTVAGTPGTWVNIGQVGYRSGAASPVASVTPYFIGEEYFNSTAKTWYRSTGTTTSDWKATTS